MVFAGGEFIQEVEMGPLSGRQTFEITYFSHYYILLLLILPFREMTTGRGKIHLYYSQRPTSGALGRACLAACHEMPDKWW